MSGSHARHCSIFLDSNSSRSACTHKHHQACSLVDRGFHPELKAPSPSYGATSVQPTPHVYCVDSWNARWLESESQECNLPHLIAADISHCQ